MRVVVLAFFTVGQAMGGQVRHELDLDSPTLLSLLETLRRRHGEPLWRELFDPQTGLPLARCQILVNGRHYRHLPGRLEHELSQGDEVALFPAVAGG